MPYITQERRNAIDAGEAPVNAGELTYVLTLVAIEYVEVNGRRFATFAEILAALDATAREFYRRVIAPYEDDKIDQNGDVYL